MSSYLRAWDEKRVYCLFNFNNVEAFVTWYAFKEHGIVPTRLHDHWSNETLTVGGDEEYLILQPYQFYILEVV